MDKHVTETPATFSSWQVNRLRARLLIYYMSEHWDYQEYKRRSRSRRRGSIGANSRPSRPSYKTLADEILACPACEKFVYFFNGDECISSEQASLEDDGAFISARSMQLFLGGDIKTSRNGRRYRKFAIPENTRGGHAKLGAIHAFLRDKKLIDDDQLNDDGLQDLLLHLTAFFEQIDVRLVHPLEYPLLDGDYVAEWEDGRVRVLERLAVHPTPARNRLQIYDPIYGVRCEELRFLRHHGESLVAFEQRVSRGQWDECVWRDGGGALALGSVFRIYQKDPNTHQVKIRSLQEAYVISEKVSAFRIQDGKATESGAFIKIEEGAIVVESTEGMYKSIDEIICNYANESVIMSKGEKSKEGARAKPILRGKFLFKRDKFQPDVNEEVDAELERKMQLFEQLLVEKWGPIVSIDEPPIKPNLDLMPMSERDLRMLNGRVTSAASARMAYPVVEKSTLEEKLLFAAQNALPDLAGNLIEAGADVNYVSPETGKTPLLTAATFSTRFVIMKLLEARGIDHLVRDRSGQIAASIFAEIAPADDPLVQEVVNAAKAQAHERGIDFNALFTGFAAEPKPPSL